MDFASTLRANGVAELVGEPTGNAPSCYGDILGFTLPESDLAFTVSYKKFIRPDPQRDPADTLPPDHPVLLRVYRFRTFSGSIHKVRPFAADDSGNSTAMDRRISGRYHPPTGIDLTILPQEHQMIRSAAIGVACAILGVFPIAALMAMAYRFPIPFSGYESGPEAAVRSLFAVVFYGAVGGFVLIAAIGATGGAIAHTYGEPKGRLRRTMLLALAGDLAAVMVLAVLDKIIGPW